MKYSRLLLVSIVCLAVLPVLAQNVPPQTITQLKTYYPDTTVVEGGKASCVIVYPDEDGYAELAQEVASAIKAASGADVPLKTDKQYTQADRETNLICLGRMNNNKLALDLYIFHYIACDDWFPGPGDDEHPPGFVVRSCCDPWGTGKNVIMLGGTELAGVKLAVEYFKGMLQKGDTLTIPRTIKTQFKGIENLEEFVKTLEPHYQKVLDRKTVSGLEGYDAILGYLLTGRDEYAQAFAKVLRHWMDGYYTYSSYRQLTQFKYAIPNFILAFDQIEESPLLPDELKLELTNLLHDHVSRMSVNSGRITPLKPGVLVPTGHHDVSQTVVYGARYFKQYYPEADFERIDRGLASVQIGQETIRATYGILDYDHSYTKKYPTTTMLLSLAMDNYDYFTSGNARKSMEFFYMIGSYHGQLYYYSPSMAIAAWYYQDPTYVWLHNVRKRKWTYYPECKPDSLTYTVWLYLPNIEPHEPELTSGIEYLTVHPTNYEQIKRQGSFVNVPRERTFHKLVMRNGYGRDAQFLRLDGINDGICNGGFGNAIPWMADGRSWLTGGYWAGGRSMKYHCSCLALRDGQMASKRVAFCDLQLAVDLPASGFVRSVMHEYNGLDWARNIAWIKGKYWIIFDQLQVLEPADYSIFCQWLGAGGSVDEQYRSTPTNRDHTLYLQAAGGTRPLVSTLDNGMGAIRQGQHGQFAKGDEPTFVHLLYGHKKIKPHDYSIKRISHNMCLVTEPDRQVLVGVRPLGQPDNPMVLSPQMQVNCTLFALAADEISLADLTSFGGEQPMLQTDKPIGLSIDLAQGLVTVKAEEATELTLRGLKVAEGTISVAQPTAVATVQLKAGETQFQADTATGPLAAIAQIIPDLIAKAAQRPPATIETKRPEYPQKLVQQWEFKVPEGKNVNVRTVESGDLDGDGRQEVFVGTADGRMFCLTPDGAQQWEFVAGVGIEDAKKIGINDIAVADLGQGPRVLVSSDDQFLYCLDAEGKELWKFTGQGIQCTNQAPGVYGVGRYIEGDGPMFAIEVADINGDGTKEILVGSGTIERFGTLWCLNPAGELQWHLYQSGGNVTTITVFDPAGDGQMLIALGTTRISRNTYIVDNQGNMVSRHGIGTGDNSTNVGRIAPDGSFRYVRVRHGNAYLDAYEVTDPHERKWSFTAGGLSGTGPEVADLNGDGIAEVIVGSGSGNIYCLNEAEEPLTWRVNLREPIAVIAVEQLSGEGPQIIAGASSGGLHIVSGDGKPLAYAAGESAVTCLSHAQLEVDGAEALVAATKTGAVATFVLQ